MKKKATSFDKQIIIHETKQAIRKIYKASLRFLQHKSIYS